MIEGFRLTLGSSSAIFAHNLSVLGTRVGMISKIGADPLGKMSFDALAKAGVDLTHVLAASSGTSTGLTVILAQPEHRFILTYPGTMFELSYEDLDLDYIFSARHLHLSSYFLQKALRPRIADLFREAKTKGLTTSLDTNDDPDDKWNGELTNVLPFADILFPNEREAKKIAATDDLEQAVQKAVAGLRCGSRETWRKGSNRAKRIRKMAARCDASDRGGCSRRGRQLRRGLHSPLSARRDSAEVSRIRRNRRRSFNHPARWNGSVQRSQQRRGIFPQSPKMQS